MWHWDCVLVMVEYKGTRVMNKLSLMWRGLLSKWKPILRHTFVSCHSLDDLKIWIFRTNSSEATFEENISNFLDICSVIRNEIHRKEVLALETKELGRNRLLPFVRSWLWGTCFHDTEPTLSVYYKRTFNEKGESSTKPTTTSPCF